MALQAQQIVSLACQIAKCPGMVIQAGQFLNNVLQSLAQDYDFEVIRKTHTFTFDTSSTGNGYVAGCGPNLMPTDFLRAHKLGAFYYISGVPYTMIGYEQSEFDRFVQQAGNAAYPYAFYIDVSKSPMELYCWVPAAGAYAATVRYNPQVADIATPESSTTIPWFPNTDYLINATAMSLMGITNDDRRQAGGPFSPEAISNQLLAYLKLKDDPESASPKRVSLDRRFFSNGQYSRLPNTKSIGWCFAAMLLALQSFPVHAQSTKAQLNTEITTSFVDNTTGLITPQVLRTVTSDIVNSIMPTAPVVASNTTCFDGTTGLLKDCGVAPNPVLLTGQITVGVTGLAPVATDPTTWFDNVWCSTVGYGIFKSTGVWKCDRSIPIPITLFGAIADSGATDNGPLIRAAYDYAAANGLAVKIPRSNGWFGISTCRNDAAIDGTSLTVANGNKSVSIFGGGWSEKPFATPTGSWIMPNSSFPSTCSFIRLSGSDKVASTVYDGFGIGEFGGSLGTPKGLHGIFIDASNPAYYQQNMRINNVYIGNTAAGYSIKCTTGSAATPGCMPDSSIINSKFMSFNADFLADHVTIGPQNTIGQNTTVDSRNVGIEFANCSGCTSTTIVNNNISNFNGMVVAHGANKLVVRDNEMELSAGFTNTRSAMIDLVGDVAIVEGYTITGNQLAQNSLVGDYAPVKVAIARGQVYDNRIGLAKATPYDYVTITGAASSTFIGINDCSYANSFSTVTDLSCTLSNLGPGGFQYTPYGFSLPGSSTGRATISTQAAAGTAAFALGTAGGTFASSATSPLVLSATTGILTCPTCATTGGASIPAIAQGDLLYGSAVNTLAALAKSTGSSNFLKNSGTSNNPAWAQPAFSDISSNLTLAQFPSLATNTVLSNATAGSAVPTALAVASCSTSSSALNWTTNTGFGCNTAIAASTATTATNATNGTTVAVTTNASFFPLFVASSSNGNQPFNLDTTFTYNPSTDTLTATNFAGNASTATTVTTNANLTGDVTSVGNATTLTNAPVIAKVLTGYTSGAGTVSASDSILSAIQKLNGNDALKAPLASPTFTGTATIPTVAATTINAFTLAGTIAGGGNNLNNIVIGQTTPLAGSFTTLSASTSVTSPLYIGGSGTTGTQATFKTTTGAGTTDAFAFVGGNNGATSFGTWDTTALVAAANLGVGGSITGTQTGTQITASLQPMLVVRATGGSATKQMARFTYDPASSLTNPGFLFQSLTDAGAFATNDNVFWGAGGGISVGSLTYPGVGGLQISGQIFMPSITTSSAAQTGTVCWTTGTGKFTVDTTVGCLTSLLAAKNITERLAPAKALDIVNGLNPFAFRYKLGYGDSGRYEQFGFGAEEVSKVDERLVGRDPEGVLQGVRYQEMTAVLAGAIQQLKADNDNLRADIQVLKSSARK